MNIPVIVAHISDAEVAQNAYIRSLRNNPLERALRFRNQSIADFESYVYNPQEMDEVRSDPVFIERAELNQWKSRKDRGIPVQTCIFDFIGAVYSPWLGNGMTQADLRFADFAAYRAMRARMDREGLKTPGDLDLPTRHDAHLSSITNPEEAEKLVERRAYKREWIAGYRARLVENTTDDVSP